MLAIEGARLFIRIQNRPLVAPGSHAALQVVKRYYSAYVA
jgi:hypothetical protein